MNKILFKIYICLTAFLICLSANAQTDRHEVRSGNRKFAKEKWQEAEIDYRKAIVKDSMSFAANYNLASTLYREQNFQESAKSMERISEQAELSANASDYYYNLGNIAVAQKNWQGAVDAFKKSLLINPGDIDAKENYIYAKKMLENQQNGGGGDNNQDNQDNNQDKQNDQNNQNKDNNENNDDNKDNNKDKDQGNKDQNQDKQNSPDNNQSSGDGQSQQKISPQQAQQMLRAIQAKEKETQDKVNKEKAAALKSRQKDKNW